MAGPNSWILPGNGILGGVYVGPPRPDDRNSEPETPWARALREAMERQPPGEAERLGTVAEQIRAGANSGNPLARPAQALVNWMRQPSPPPQMSQKQMIGPAPYYALDIDDRYPNAKIGRAIINHYADYLDPWTYDAQGRRVIDTPAAYTPNNVGKLPETEKPWWWPMVGGVDLGSNFVGLGAGTNLAKAATVGGRAAFAAPKAAVAEAGMTGKLLNAVREGRLAELASEGAETLASRWASMYNPPAKTPRPFEADYPRGAPADAEGRLIQDIEGRPLTARHVVGRQVYGGTDVALPQAELPAVAEGSAGAVITDVAPRTLGKDLGRVVKTTDRRSGNSEYEIWVRRGLSARDVPLVTAHEVSHLIDDLAGKIPTDGLSRELYQVYNTLNTGKERTRNLTRPRDIGYSESEEPGELMAEAVRAYMWDPNYLKTVAPKTAARIREFVNANPQLSKVIQFNAIGGAVPFIQGQQRNASGVEDRQ